MVVDCFSINFESQILQNAFSHIKKNCTYKAVQLLDIFYLLIVILSLNFYWPENLTRDFSLDIFVFHFVHFVQLFNCDIYFQMKRSSLNSWNQIRKVILFDSHISFPIWLLLFVSTHLLIPTTTATNKFIFIFFFSKSMGVIVLWEIFELNITNKMRSFYVPFKWMDPQFLSLSLWITINIIIILGWLAKWLKLKCKVIKCLLLSM